MLNVDELKKATLPPLDYSKWRSTSFLFRAEDSLRQREVQLLELVAKLSAAEEEVEQLKKDVKYLGNHPMHSDAGDCVSFYDGCHCTLEALEHNIKRSEAAEERVGVLEKELRERKL